MCTYRPSSLDEVETDSTGCVAVNELSAIKLQKTIERFAF